MSGLETAMSGFVYDSQQQEALHAELQILLAGYVDQELEEDEKRQVEAHLVGCAHCREDLIRQTLLQQRLGQYGQSAAVSTGLHQRLDAIVETGVNNRPDCPGVTTPVISKREKWRDWLAGFNGHWGVLSGWALACVLLLVLLLPPFQPASDVPMVSDALAQYQRMQASPLPLSAAGATGPTDDSPVSWPGSRVLASWSTQVGGEQAQAYWLRSGESTLLVLRISEAVFFRHPEVREAVEHRGVFHYRGDLSVLAIPTKISGVLIVGSENALPDVGEIHTF
jgi:anti-sigma factor RsiW